MGRLIPARHAEGGAGRGISVEPLDRAKLSITNVKSTNVAGTETATSKLSQIPIVHISTSIRNNKSKTEDCLYGPTQTATADSYSGRVSSTAAVEFISDVQGEPSAGPRTVALAMLLKLQGTVDLT